MKSRSTACVKVHFLCSLLIDFVKMEIKASTDLELHLQPGTSQQG